MPAQESTEELPLLRNEERTTRRPMHMFGARYERSNGTVTLRLPSPVARADPMSARGRARTVSSVAPLPESCYTINVFLFFLTCFQLVNLLTFTYTGSVINYIAKRFLIPNTMASFIPTSYQIGNMVAIIPVSFYGKNWNRPKAIAIGVVIMIIGLGFCVLPHFILPSPNQVDTNDTELCSNKTWFQSQQEGHADTDQADDTEPNTLLAIPNDLPCNANGTAHNPALLLLIGHGLLGAGAAPLWPLGIAYIDDHVVLRKVSIYVGIFTGTTLMGPVFGFLLGSLSSAIYVTLGKHDMSQSNPAWIGAWWLGYVVSCLMLVVLLFPFSFYPRALPVSAQKQAEIDEIYALQERGRISRTQSQLDASGTRQADGISQSETSSVAGCSTSAPIPSCKDSGIAVIISKIAELFCAIKQILSTPLVLTAIISYIAMANLLSGVATFGSSYVQRVFNLLRTTSDMLIGGVCVPMGILGTFVGGYLMKKYNFDIRQTLIYTITMSSIGCLMLVFLFAFGCQTQHIAGLTVPYRNTAFENLTNVCNYGCRCPAGQYFLVCGADRTTYLSPCHAGCKSEEWKTDTVFKKKTVYSNCSCVHNREGTAESGACNTQRCSSMLAGFMILVAFGVMFLCLCQAPVYVVLLRMLETDYKSLGIGLMSFAARVFGYVPGPIWFGMILDRSCIYWSPKCHGKSRCLLYNTNGMRYSYVGLSFACAFAYMMVFAISFAWMECHKDKYEKSGMLMERPASNSSDDDEQTRDSEINAPWR